jgi:ubiquinone/menaquinone biosynthesis C-methylase UbiE
MQKIADYDEFHYDYKSYWDERDYENKAEIEVLNKLLNEEKGDYFVDIGGSFGRNAPLYSKRYKHPIIVDYSLETLQKYQEEIQKENPNIQLIAANAYKLPFKSSVIDGAMMIRVLHHLSDQDGVFKEASRILKENGVYILEFANKMHIKAGLNGYLPDNFRTFLSIHINNHHKRTMKGARKVKIQYFLISIQKIYKINLKNRTSI